ncbi:MAG: hypothetical protein QM753_08780 [Thermomicrobiales bacterium]
MPEPPAKTCRACGTTFTRKPTETRDHYRHRSTCSQECLRALPRQQAVPKAAPLRETIDQRTCPVCGRTFHRRPDESQVKFAQKLACSRSCGARIRWEGERAGAYVREPSDEEIDRRAQIILARMAMK